MDTTGTQNPRAIRKAAALRAAFIALVLLQLCLAEGIVLSTITQTSSFLTCGPDVYYYDLLSGDIFSSAFLFLLLIVCSQALSIAVLSLRRFVINLPFFKKRIALRIAYVELVPLYVSLIIISGGNTPRSLPLPFFVFSAISYLIICSSAIFKWISCKLKTTKRRAEFATGFVFAIVILLLVIGLMNIGFDELPSRGENIYCFAYYLWMSLLNFFVIYFLIPRLPERSAPAWWKRAAAIAIAAAAIVLPALSGYSIITTMKENLPHPRYTAFPMLDRQPPQRLMILKTWDNPLVCTPNRIYLKGLQLFHPEIKAQSFSYDFKRDKLAETPFKIETGELMSNPVHVAACDRIATYETHIGEKTNKAFPFIARDRNGRILAKNYFEDVTPSYLVPLPNGKDVLLQGYSRDWNYIWDVCSNKIYEPKMLHEYLIASHLMWPATISADSKWLFYGIRSSGSSAEGLYTYDFKSGKIDPGADGPNFFEDSRYAGTIHTSPDGEKALLCQCGKRRPANDIASGKDCTLSLYNMESSTRIAALHTDNKCYSASLLPQSDKIIFFSGKNKSLFDFNKMEIADWSGKVEKTISAGGEDHFARFAGHATWITKDYLSLSDDSIIASDGYLINIPSGRIEKFSDIIARHEKKK